MLLHQVQDASGVPLEGGGGGGGTGRQADEGRSGSEAGEATCSCGLPPLLRTSRLMMSRDSRPMVRPDIRPVGGGANTPWTRPPQLINLQIRRVPCR